MEQISIAEVRRRMPPGTTYLGEFIGEKNRTFPEINCTRRRVKVNTKSQMVSEFLTGPKSGHQAYNEWKGVKATISRESDIILSLDDKPYLKITICPER